MLTHRFCDASPVALRHLSKRYAPKLKRATKAFAAMLALKLTEPTGSTAAPQVPVSVG